jgi:sucrose synthase
VCAQVVYILDQVRALEREMLARSRRQGLSITPQILVVTRLIPNAQGTTCNQRIERINGTQYARILRVPFRDQHGILQDWISRRDCPPCALAIPFNNRLVRCSGIQMCTAYIG